MSLSLSLCVSEYPKHMFVWRNKKNIYKLHSLIRAIILTYLLLILYYKQNKLARQTHFLSFGESGSGAGNSEL